MRELVIVLNFEDFVRDFIDSIELKIVVVIWEFFLRREK